jgi:hypothetical protein
MKKTLPIWIIACSMPFFFSFNNDNDTGQAGASGAFTEGTCSKSGCHTGTADNSAGGAVVIASTDIDLLATQQYVPGQTYQMSVAVMEEGRSTFGFSMSALRADGTNGGNLTAGAGNNILNLTVTGDARSYVSQNTEGIGPNMFVWNFTWTAPAGNAGPITFYATGNAADGNSQRTNDHIYSTSLTVDAAVGVEENTVAQPDLTMYPNPAQNLLNVETTAAEGARVQIQVYTLDGKLAHSLFQGTHHGGSAVRTFNIDHLATGSYVLSVAIDGKQQAARLFEKH